MRFTVSILTYVALRQAKACIASVLQSTVPFKLVLTANGNPEAAAYFQGIAAEFSHVTVNVNLTNEGFIPPNLRAFAECETEFFVMLNDDTVVPRDWLEKLASAQDKFPDTGALSGPRGGCQSIQPSFHGFRGPNFEYLEGSCLCVRVAKVRPLGLFDPHLKFAYGEDSDLSLRCREAGLTLHHASFDLQHEIGATSRHVTDVRKLQGENHAYLIKRWSHYLKVRTFGYPIVIRRGAANGDVLLTTPIMRALRARSPLSPLHIDTICPQVYANHPYVSVVQRHANPDKAQIIDLNGTYEAVPDRHIVDSYAARVGLEPGKYTRETELYVSDVERRRAERAMPGEPWVAIHAGPSTWKSKEWPIDRWQAVIAHLRETGSKVVLVGSAGPTLAADADARGQTTALELGAFIQRATLFIGLDSLPLHVAEAVGTRAIGLFGITDPQFIITRPERTLGVCGTVPSFGLRHRVKGQTTVDDGGAAMNSITVEMVLEAVAKSLPIPTP